MGYRSRVALKTTTEGYLTMVAEDKKIASDDEKALLGSSVFRSEAGNYKIEFDDVKWYDSYRSVQNFTHYLDILEEMNIPFSFIRLGEDYDDIEYRQNYTDDMPDDIATYAPSVDIYDDEYSYEELD